MLSQKEREALLAQENKLIQTLPEKLERLKQFNWLLEEKPTHPSPNDPVFKSGHGIELYRFTLSSTVCIEGCAIKFEFKLTFRKKTPRITAAVPLKDRHYYSLFIYDPGGVLGSCERFCRCIITHESSDTEKYKTLRSVFEELLKVAKPEAECSTVKQSVGFETFNQMFQRL